MSSYNLTCYTTIFLAITYTILNPKLQPNVKGIFWFTFKLFLKYYGNLNSERFFSNGSSKKGIVGILLVFKTKYQQCHLVIKKSNVWIIGFVGKLQKVELL